MDQKTNDLKPSTGDRTFRPDRSSQPSRIDGNPDASSESKYGKASGDLGDCGSKVEDAAESLGERAHAAGARISEGGHQLMERSRSAHQAVCEFTTANPTAALLIAIGFGAIFTRFLPRR